MSIGRILVVDDDPKIVQSVRLYLEHAGYEVVTAFNGVQALAEVEHSRPDLIVLDLMLPRVDGMEVCRRVRERSPVPIVLLTARAGEEDVLAGLGLGADDYVTKPFSPRELVARVETVLRRAPPAAGAVRRAGPLELDCERREVRLRGAAIEVTPKEFRLLETFMASRGRAWTREALIAQAFGGDYTGLERTIDVHVMNLRRKIEDDAATPRFIRTVFGVGYRFEEPADA